MKGIHLSARESLPSPAETKCDPFKQNANIVSCPTTWDYSIYVYFNIVNRFTGISLLPTCKKHIYHEARASLREDERLVLSNKKKN
jgi:hypothetical protein